MGELVIVSEKTRTYYVRGSRLIPVPNKRLNEIPDVKVEYHVEEAKKARLLSFVTRPA